MTKEVRVLFLTVLTLVFYAVSIFLSQGAFIFPFPLNELILLVVSMPEPMPLILYSRYMSWAKIFVINKEIIKILDKIITNKYNYKTKNYKRVYTNEYYLLNIFEMLNNGSINDLTNIKICSYRK